MGAPLADEVPPGAVRPGGWAPSSSGGSGSRVRSGWKELFAQGREQAAELARAPVGLDELHRGRPRHQPGLGLRRMERRCAQQAIYDALGIDSAPGGIRKTVVQITLELAVVVPLADL